MKSLPLVWRYEVNVKSTGTILSIFVAFLENMNFKMLGYNRTKGMEFEFHDLHLILDSTFKEI